jgi:hypothetical protein
MRSIVLLVLGIWFVVPASKADDAAAREAIEFSASMSIERAAQQVKAFKSAVRAGRCEDVRDLVRFPLRMNRGGTVRWLKRREFCGQYPSIFDEARSSVVAQQDLASMPMGYRGLMFGDGILWLQPVCADPARAEACPVNELYLRLVTVNL